MAREKNACRSNHRESSSAQAASKMLKISMLRMALMNHAQTVTGNRVSVIPLARRSITVTLKLMATSSEPRQNIATLTSHNFIPSAGARKNAPVIPAKDPMVIQKAAKLRFGKAVSVAPICKGRK